MSYYERKLDGIICPWCETENIYEDLSGLIFCSECRYDDSGTCVRCEHYIDEVCSINETPIMFTCGKFSWCGDTEKRK
jgi:hypothetical protein